MLLVHCIFFVRIHFIYFKFSIRLVTSNQPVPFPLQPLLPFKQQIERSINRYKVKKKKNHTQQVSRIQSLFFLEKDLLGYLEFVGHLDYTFPNQLEMLLLLFIS